MKTKTIGIVGTAKNTGKTTTLAALLEECHNSGKPTGLTGIGYDGEATDNLTFLAKPRLDVPSGIWVVTAHQCIEVASARLKNLEGTGIITSLGEVFLGQVSLPGKIILAGPNQRKPLCQVLDLLKEKGCAQILVDGSLGRIIPLTAADGLIYATGAAHNTHPETLAKEMESIVEIFSWQDYPPSSDFPEKVTVNFQDRSSKSIGLNSLLTMEDLEELFSDKLLIPKEIFIPGVIGKDVWEPFLEKVSGLEVNLNFFNPGTLLLRKNIQVLSKLLKEFREKGGKIAFSHPLPIKAITLNPFYPKRETSHGMFNPAFIDKKELKESFQKRISLPLFNILENSKEDLYQACFG